MALTPFLGQDLTAYRIDNTVYSITYRHEIRQRKPIHKNPLSKGLLSQLLTGDPEQVQRLAPAFSQSMGISLPKGVQLLRPWCSHGIFRSRKSRQTVVFRRPDQLEKGQPSPSGGGFFGFCRLSLRKPDAVHLALNVLAPWAAGTGSPAAVVSGELSLAGRPECGPYLLDSNKADLAVFLFWCGMYVTFLFLIHQRSFSILFESFFIIIHILPLIGHQTDILPYQSSIFCFIVIYERYERNPQIIIQ